MPISQNARENNEGKKESDGRRGDMLFSSLSIMPLIFAIVLGGISLPVYLPNFLAQRMRRYRWKGMKN